MLVTTSLGYLLEKGKSPKSGQAINLHLPSTQIRDLDSISVSAPGPRRCGRRREKPLLWVG
ncbi:MAG: hypothetical protein K0R52_769 [Alphaproteobacteria bacterium]|jgi:hypothetical protein|nr:hypothetical protein [Alphaproteobacteria bacterium]